MFDVFPCVSISLDWVVLLCVSPIYSINGNVEEEVERMSVVCFFLVLQLKNMMRLICGVRCRPLRPVIELRFGRQIHCLSLGRGRRKMLSGKWLRRTLRSHYQLLGFPNCSFNFKMKSKLTTIEETTTKQTIFR